MLNFRGKKRVLTALALLIAAGVCFFHCTGKRAHGNARASAPQIVCVTYPVWLITRDLMRSAPDTAPVLSLLVPPDTGCPHDYALTPGELLKISRAGRLLLLRNGAGLDDALFHTALKAKPSLESADASARFRPENPEKLPPHAAMDAHLFTSPAAVRKMAYNLAEALRKFDPANAALYTENEEDFLRRLPNIPEKPKDGKKCKFLAMHGTFTHLLNDLGFEQTGVAVSGHSFDLSPAEMRRLVALIRAEKIAYLISEPQAPARIAQTLAKETGIRILMLDSAASGPEDPPAFYLCNVIRNNIRLLQNAVATETQETPEK